MTTVCRQRVKSTGFTLCLPTDCPRKTLPGHNIYHFKEEKQSFPMISRPLRSVSMINFRGASKRKHFFNRGFVYKQQNCRIRKSHYVIDVSQSFPLVVNLFRLAQCRRVRDAFSEQPEQRMSARPAEKITTLFLVRDAWVPFFFYRSSQLPFSRMINHSNKVERLFYSHVWFLLVSMHYVSCYDEVKSG